MSSLPDDASPFLDETEGQREHADTVAQLPPTFFHEMPAMQRLSDVIDERYYRRVPASWAIALTDVRNSTIAIHNGQYKSVNSIGAATITAILNSVPNIDIPFLFGGDGAAVVVPPHAVEQAREALVAVKNLAKKSFDLDLRIGLVPVSLVYSAGYDLKVAKLHMSENFQQPVFTGGGLAYADTLLKSDHFLEQHGIIEDGNETANFEGFECRWSKHPAAKDEIISLLVQATNDDADDRNQMYLEVIDTIDMIYGNAEERHPIDVERMSVATRPNDYRNEVAIKNERFTWRDILTLMFWSIGGYLLWNFVNKIWNDYREVVHKATDHEKFDDMLRMTISGTIKQREQLSDYLQDRYLDGDLAYGIHVAQHTLMTCIVFDRFGRQVHFLDADKGGYAMAAQQLKTQLKYRSTTTTPQVIEVDL